MAIARNPFTVRAPTWLGAAGGVVGPLAFASAWLIGSLSTPGYSMIDHAISRLAAIGADTRVLMTLGFLGFTVGVLMFSATLRKELPGRSWIAAATTAIATAGVAAFPLDRSDTVDALHGIAATIGYAGLSATSLFAAASLKLLGRHRESAVSRAAGLATAFCLIATILGPANGLFQRLGVTIGDAWIVAASLVAQRAAKSASVVG